MYYPGNCPEEMVRTTSPYSKLSETSRHCLMFTQTLSFPTSPVLQNVSVYREWKLSEVKVVK